MGGLFLCFTGVCAVTSSSRVSFDDVNILFLSGRECGTFEMALAGKLTKKLVENLGAGRHGDGNGLYLVVDPSGAGRWIVRVVVKGQKNKKGAPLRTDFGLGGADIVTIHQARKRALEYWLMRVSRNWSPGADSVAPELLNI